MERKSNLLLAALFVILAACSDRKEGQAKAPRPGDVRLLQMYVLSDPKFALPLLSVQSLQEKLSDLRVEKKEVATLEEAAETLKIWNARPVDFLILGEGAPQLAWSKANLAKVNGRSVFFWNSQSEMPGGVNVKLSPEGIKKTIQKICAPSNSGPCRFYPEANFLGLKSATPFKVTFSIGYLLSEADVGLVLNNDIFIEKAREIKKLDAQKDLFLSMESALLEFKLNPASPHRAVLEKQMKNAMLESLSNGN